jgi:hypothetical protein
LRPAISLQRTHGMLNRMRKTHGAAFKAKVAPEAVKGEKTITQIASDLGVHPNRSCGYEIALPRTSRIPAPGAETPRLTTAEMYSRSVGRVNSRLLSGKHHPTPGWALNIRRREPIVAGLPLPPDHSSPKYPPLSSTAIRVTSAKIGKYSREESFRDQTR